MVDVSPLPPPPTTVPSSDPSATTSQTSIKPTQPIPAKSTLVKTDKPRPHICTTCTRSFARLEHLKRHERSHTKEKPFECPVCERCFARRDLLLRHKQKLHASFPEPPRVRNGSVSKKSSTPSASTKSSSGISKKTMPSPNVSSPFSNGSPNNINTGYSNSSLSPGDVTSATSPNKASPFNSSTTSNAHTHVFNRQRGASFSAASATSYSTYKDIALMEQSIQNNFSPGATQVSFATPQLLPANLNEDVPIEDFFNSSDPLFINPQLLGHSENSGSAPSDNNSAVNTHDNLAWLMAQHDSGLLSGAPLSLPDHNKISPPSNFGSVSDDMSSSNAPTSMSTSISPATTDHSDLFNIKSLAVANPLGNTSSQYSLKGEHPEFNLDNEFWKYEISNGLNQPAFSSFQDSEMSFESLDPTAIHFPSNMQPQFATSTNGHTSADSVINGTAPSSTSPNANGSSSTNSKHIITPHLRLHILTTLSTPTPFTSNQPPHLPSTLELQRYIDAYTENFGKHLPLLHHTLDFTPDNIPLALVMAAIGALYLFEHSSAANIFEISRCCVHVYLESRRERKNSEAQGSKQDHDVTPLWLVQALILGVIYGLFNDELLANEIAVAQANAVISLAKSAGLHLSPHHFLPLPAAETSSVEEKWHYFIMVQERIRTMHVVFTVSCMLATGYNVASTIRSSDIKCGSPCDESLWTASSSDAWWEIMRQKELDGSLRDAVVGPVFSECLDRLLSGNTLVNKIPQFTLLSLMYAIHLEIHDRRIEYDQNEETASSLDDPHRPSKEVLWLEREKRPLEAILRAWETTWSLSPLASLNPNSQFGPLMSDSIPLSSLTYVRVFLDLRKVKECFWKRDFVAMGRELDNLNVTATYDSQGAGRKQFNGLVEAASYAADTISLWEKHSVRWTLEATALQTFIHTLVSLFDCGLVVSEFFNRLEKRDPFIPLQEDEKLLLARVRKIFYRVLDVVGSDDNMFASNVSTTSLGSFDQRSGSVSAGLDTAVQGISLNDERLSLMALKVVSKILSEVYVWPCMYNKIC